MKRKPNGDMGTIKVKIDQNQGGKKPYCPPKISYKPPGFRVPLEVELLETGVNDASMTEE